MLKATGVVRRLDELGRIVLPMELRRTMNIGVRDQLEIFVDKDAVVLKKYEKTCIFCGKAKDLVEFKGKIVCGDCRADLKEA